MAAPSGGTAGDPAASGPQRAEREAAAPAGPIAALGSRAQVLQTLERLQARLAEASTGYAYRDPVFTRAGPHAGTMAPARHIPPSLEAQLRESVRAYARALRADGVPSESMLILVKSVVREATPAELAVGEARALMDDLVRESIGAFYGVAPGP